MTNTEYLQGILKAQSLSEDSDELKALQEKRKDVEKLLRSSFEESDPKIVYGGSYAKKTLIRENYDLDMICYFAHDDTTAGEALKDIYENVAKALGEKYFVDYKTSALRLKGKSEADYKVDFHIDVVPGRFTDDKEQDVFIYQQGSEKKWLKTNPAKHISHIRDSELIDAIKLLKLWNVRRGLGLKTFVLELMVVKLISKQKNKPLDEQLITFWQTLVDSRGDVTVEDPANPSGNDLSEFNSVSMQSMLESNATNSLDLIKNSGWELIFVKLDDASNDTKSKALSNIAVIGATRTKPWANYAKKW
jgi:tRNA nucleotidyltransferase (CCA-adding enzyme)